MGDIDKNHRIKIKDGAPVLLPISAITANYCVRCYPKKVGAEFIYNGNSYCADCVGKVKYQEDQNKYTSRRF